MCGFCASSTVRYWSESTPMAHLPLARRLDRVEDTQTRLAGGVVDDVGAVLVHRRGRVLATVGFSKPASPSFWSSVRYWTSILIDGSTDFTPAV